MKNVACSLLILLFCQISAAAPGCWADDSSANKSSDAQKAGKGKKGKPSKSDSPAQASTAASPSSTPTSSADTSDASVDQTLDLYLGKNAPTTGSAIPPGSDSGGSGGGGNYSSGSNMDSGGGSSGGSNGDDQVMLGDHPIPETTLKAGELNNSAIEAMNNKNFQKAIDLLKQALVVDPGYAQGKGNLQVAYFNYGVDLYNNEKYAEAIPLLEKALAIAKQLGHEDADLKHLYDDCKQAVKDASASAK